MKKQILVSTLIAFATTTTIAQTNNTFPTTGEVGIGTTTPSAKLHITQSTNDEAIIIGNGSLETTQRNNSITFTNLNTGIGDNQLRWLDGNGNVSGGITTTNSSNRLGLLLSGARGSIYFNAGGTNSNAEKMRLLSTGELGIGIKLPTELLDVNGNARFRDITDGPNDFITTHDKDGVLHRIAFTGKSTDVLLGDGTFGSLSGFKSDFAVLTKVIKEQQKIIEVQNRKIAQLEKNSSFIDESYTELNNEIKAMKMLISDNNNRESNTFDIWLSNNNSEEIIFLGQNHPNPFRDVTTITYSIPKEVNNSRIEIYSLSGNLLKSESLESGNGTINIHADNLEKGSLMYSIIADEKIIETKKMVVIK